jgi:predicted methyltransferase
MNKVDNVMKEIADKMAEEGRPMINLAALFIKEPLSLETLLMLEDKGPMTIDQVSNYAAEDVVGSVNIIDLLNKLKGFDVINVKDNTVSITDRGQCIVVKLRMKMNNLGDDVDKLCNIKHDCIYNNDDC